MGLWARLFGQNDPTGAGTYKEVSCQELFAAAAEYTLLNMSFEVCVDMVANAIGRCEFRTYLEGVEAFGPEYWLWNLEPNLNENSTAFLHKLVDRLYRHNEALVVSFRRRDGYENLVVADSWNQSAGQVTRQNEYRHVVVDGYEFNKTFKEADVLHFRLQQEAIKPVIDRLTKAWEKMAQLAMNQYKWDHGAHWKVHVSQVAAGGDEFEANFAAMIAAQVKPFMESDNGVLPEFDGYTYERMGGSGAGSNATSQDLRDLAADIFDFTARGFLIPAVLVNGKVEATNDANNRFLTYVIDPLCDQLQEEITRKRYGYEMWTQKSYLKVDSSQIIHYDLFSQAAGVEKLVGSGVYSINDILRAVGQGTINEPWANKHYLTLNIAEMGQAATPLGE